jgi:ATP-dependent Clp protease ATP-binding subunit ClpX
VCAYNHYKKILFDELDSDVAIDKSNIIMIGPTGSGKTLLAQTLAKKLSVPFAIADATTLTEAGYVGEDVESLLERLLLACDWDIDRAQRGIVFIDEIDKKARSSESNTSTKDISGEGVQQALLRLIEGTIVKVPMGNSKKADTYVDFDTSGILFICSGAFVGLEKTIKDRTNKKTIGFRTEISNVSEFKWQQYVEHKDLIAYGLIPEFVGRLPNIVTLEELTENDMISILQNSKVSVIKQVQKLLSFDEVNLEFSENYFKGVAKLAKDKNIGARGLKSIVENSLHNIMYNAPTYKDLGITTIVFDEYPGNSVDTYPKVVYNNGNVETLGSYKMIRRGVN